MAKITRTTIKSFINKNTARPGQPTKLYINVKSDFDGMVDMVTERNEGFVKLDIVSEPKFINEHNLGYRQLWLVGQSRDSFELYEDREFKGYKIYNCCGSSILAIKQITI